MNVSAQATPIPETIPERRLFDRVRHGTYRDGSGHTYADAAEQGFDDFQCHFSGS